jgi:ABC-2 type transport system ATP-binding protein
MAIIQLESVSKIFPRRPLYLPWLASDSASDVVALKNVFLTVEAGEVLAVLGPNGSGKSTLLRLIATMLLPDSGRVIVEGLDAEDHPAQVRKSVGFAIGSERSFYPRLTATENLEFFCALEEVPKAERRGRVLEVLHLVGLNVDAERLVMKYSAGMLQRLGIARALLKWPPVLLLDEPSRSLDPVSREELWRLIHRLSGEGTAVLLASHDFDEVAAVANRVAVLCSGILTGTRGLDTHTTSADIRHLYLDLSGEDVSRALHAHGEGQL